jgi:hypothetical protein
MMIVSPESHCKPITHDDMAVLRHVSVFHRLLMASGKSRTRDKVFALRQRTWKSSGQKIVMAISPTAPLWCRGVQRGHIHEH